MHDPNYIKITTGLFIMLNPFVLIPVFLGLTGGMNKGQKMKVAFTTSIAVFIIMMISVFGGHHVLSFFGITINDFRIAGGLLIFLMAISMARAEKEGMRYSGKEHEEAQTKDANIAVVPLAIPLMAGPAAISVSIIDAELCSAFCLALDSRGNYRRAERRFVGGHGPGGTDWAIPGAHGPAGPHTGDGSHSPGPFHRVPGGGH